MTQPCYIEHFLIYFWKTDVFHFLFKVVAAYDFMARGNHEVSVRAGEPVRVLESQDKRGNSEWSLVEARGQRGYVPSNYLTRMPVGTGSLAPPLH